MSIFKDMYIQCILENTLV